MNEETTAASKDSSAIWEKKEFAQKYLTQELRDERDKLAKRIWELFPNPPERIKNYLNGEPEQGTSQVFNDGYLAAWVEEKRDRRWTSIELLELLDEGKLDELRAQLLREAGSKNSFRAGTSYLGKFIALKGVWNCKPMKPIDPGRKFGMKGLKNLRHAGNQEVSYETRKESLIG